MVLLIRSDGLNDEETTEESARHRRVKRGAFSVLFLARPQGNAAHVAYIIYQRASRSPLDLLCLSKKSFPLRLSSYRFKLRSVIENRLSKQLIAECWRRLTGEGYGCQFDGQRE